jgi:hypothetical protein
MKQVPVSVAERLELQAWCTPDEVDALVQGNPSVELLQEYADHATSLLYVLSGRRYSGEVTVVSRHQIDRRGYVKLSVWRPVRNLVSATVDGVVTQVSLSPAGTYIAFPRYLAGKYAELTLEVGQNPPQMARDAAAALAAEMLRSDSRYEALGAGDFRQSARVTSVTRQGVTFTYADPTSLMQNNMTGVYAVDLFLRATNPTGARFQPKVVTT